MSVRRAREVADRLRTLDVPWNAPFDGGPATMLSATELPGGLRVTLLSPAAGDFSRFVDMWDADSERSRRPAQQSAVQAEFDPGTSDGNTDVDADARDRLVLYFANMPADDHWRSSLIEGIGAPIAGLDMLFGDFSASDAWQRLDRADPERPRLAVILASQALLTSPFAREGIDALVDAAKAPRFALAMVLVGQCDWESTALRTIRPLNDTPLSAQRPSVATRELTRIASVLAGTIRDLTSPRVAASAGGGTSPGDTSLDVERLAGAPFRGDRSVANNASLALLLEQHGKAILIGGDASARTLTEAIGTVLRQRGRERLRLDALVVPHNGSAMNLDRDLLQLLDCDRYLIATNGAIYGHPDRETIARILAYGRPSPATPLTLVFNYRSPQTLVWDDPELQQRWNYRVVYPPQDAGGIAVHV